MDPMKSDADTLRSAVTKAGEEADVVLSTPRRGTSSEVPASPSAGVWHAGLTGRSCWLREGSDRTTLRMRWRNRVPGESMYPAEWNFLRESKTPFL